MASFNTNSNPSPFGTSSATPQPDVGAQFFLGCSVIDFTVSADWGSQGGSLSVNLIEDTLDTSRVSYNETTQVFSLDAGGSIQRLRDPLVPDTANGLTDGSMPVIGSPQSFRLLDTSSNIIFKYDGIIESITRTAETAAGKIYNVVLGSPLKLLENCSMILAEFPGYGHAKEGFVDGISQNTYYKLTNGTNLGVYYNTSTGQYTTTALDVDLDSSFNVISPNMSTHEVYENSRPSQRIVDKTTENVGIQFGTENRSINWADVYNIQNVFGVYESDSHGLTNYAKFGGSRNSGGMRFDMICYALHKLINDNADGSTSTKFGGNIISGSETYNIGRIDAGLDVANPFFYGFDILSFYNTMLTKGISADYIYEGDVTSTLIDFISKVCSDAGVDFIVELDRAQDGGAGNYYWNGTQVVTFNNDNSIYDGGSFPLLKSYTYSRVGGVISIRILDRRFVNLLRPFSDIAYKIITGHEMPDYGDWNIGRVHPGGDGNAFSNAFEQTAFGGYLDPLDDDYILKGTDGSTPYGGTFPVTDLNDQNLSADYGVLNTSEESLSNAKNTQISLRAAGNSTAKYVVGGFQSRVDYIPQKYIYQYWGEVRVPRSVEANTFGELTTAQRSIPVITPILQHDDVVDFIMIDLQDAFPNGGNAWLDNIAPGGIYAASMAEIRAAMKKKETWIDYLDKFKSCLIYSLRKAAGATEAHSKLIALSKGQFQTEDPGLTVNTKIQVTANPPEKAATIGKTTDQSAQKPSIPTPAPSKKDGSNTPTYIDFEEILNKLHAKIKEIGDTHYGKSWVAWSPQVTTKVTEDIQNFGQYQHSWVPSNDAYLEPSVFDTWIAPQHTKFMNGGRVQAYANYTAVLNNGDNIEEGENRSESISLDSGDYSFNFSEVGEDSKFKSSFSNTVHTKVNVDSEYIFVPYDYFYWYDRGRKPIIKFNTVTGSGQIYDIDYKNSDGEIDYPILTANANYSIYNGISYTIPNFGTENKDAQDNNITTMNNYCEFYNSIDYDLTPISPGSQNSYDRLGDILCNDNTNVAESPPKGISNTRLAYDFTNLICPDHGVNCFTFTKFTTDRVYFPKVNNQDLSSVKTAINNLLSLVSDSVSIPKGTTNTDRVNHKYSDIEYFDRCAVPAAVGLPQQSTRHRYGPWFTQHKFIYGGKVEMINDEGLVPENYIFPIYGTLQDSAGGGGVLNGGDFNEQLSGYDGMNYAGQAVANSIDGYGQFALEEGSMTLAGAPTIDRIGKGLFGAAPYVTELSIRVGAQGIETTYSFNTAVNKAGKTNMDIVKKIRNISTVLTSR